MIRVRIMPCAWQPTRELDLPDEVWEALATRGKSIVLDVLDQEDPPRVFEVSAGGIAPADG
jgi:hypothetical protein